MNRRNFLRTGAALSLPLLAGNPLSARVTRQLRHLVDPSAGRVLVLVQLNGGNDGLNTLVPLDQYDRLRAVRPSVLVPRGSLLEIDHDLGFHPAAAGLRDVYGNGQLAAIQGVAYPGQNRSHFRSTDIWTSASAADKLVTSGWLGRHFAADHPDYPEDYPNGGAPHPFAVALGNQVSQTCQGTGANFSMAVADPFDLLTLAGGDDTPLPETPYGSELDFLRTSIVQANAYGSVVQEAAERGNSLVDYPDNRFAAQLRHVAYLISGGLETSVYVVSLGGFDTHANQVVGGNPLLGEHAELLATLGDALSAFQQDLRALGLEQRVLAMTFSEFGRRIRANDSLGTDHGTAAPLFLMGECVRAGILGDNAVIGETVSTDAGVDMQYDFRDVYGTVLADWFGLDGGSVRQVLGHDYVHLPLLAGCGDTTSTNGGPGAAQQAGFLLSPNPTAGPLSVRLNSPGGRATLDLTDLSGRHLRRLLARQLPAGPHEVPLDLSALPPGVYLVHLRLGGRVSSQRVVLK